MTPTSEFTLGLDLAQYGFHAAIARDPDQLDWAKLPNRAIAHPPHSAEGISALRSFIAEAAPGETCARIVAEAGGAMSRRFAAAAQEAGLGPVALVNPRRPKSCRDALGVRTKTDRSDAAVIAIYGLLYKPEPTACDTPARLRLTELTRLRQAIEEDLTVWRNRLSQAHDSQAREIIESTIGHLTERRETVEDQIDRTLAEDARLQADCRLLEQIKGIGPVTARTLLAEFGDLRSYDRNQLAAAAGLCPVEHASGKSVRKRPRLAKGGGARVRRALYMCAESFFRSKGPMRDFVDQRLAAGIPKMKILCAAMRKLLLIARATLIAGKYDPSRIGKELASCST